MQSPPEVAVVGGGPAGLAAAEVLAGAGRRVALYEAMPSFGRKFLMAGRGGLNLTHSEPLAGFLARYRGSLAARLDEAIRAFPPAALVAWADALGQETFVGSSGRVFPRAMKASPLLRAWLARLEALGVALHPRHRWLGWDDARRLRFAAPGGEIVVAPAATGPGCRCWRPRAWRSRRWCPPTAASAWPGRRISASASPAHR